LREGLLVQVEGKKSFARDGRGVGSCRVTI
jgi:hypothetical protein